MKYVLLSFMLLTGGIAHSQYIITIAGDDSLGIVGDVGDGSPANAVKLRQPVRVCPDRAGNVYIAEIGNNRIRKINTAGIITTIAGTGGVTSGDGGPATAAGVDGPSSVIVDTAGNIYLSDDGSGTGARVRKIDAAGIITTFAGGGTGTAGSGDGGPATSASFAGVGDIALDRKGNMYIVDGGKANIRKIDTAGIISTIAGNGTYGYSGDGGSATLAQLDQPAGVVVDAAGNVYIADYVNSRIRKVNTTGIITTIAGTGTPGYSGDGGPASVAELYFPCGVAVDSIGNIYIADVRNCRIRKIETTGNITTVAGDSTRGFSGDSGLATAAELSSPEGVALDDSGNIYIADYGNNVVRKVTDHLPATGVAPPGLLQWEEVLRIYPNPNDGAFTVVLSSNNMETVQLTITNIVGQTIKKMTTTTNKKESVQFTGPPGIYFISAVTADGRYSGKVVVE